MKHTALAMAASGLAVVLSMGCMAEEPKYGLEVGKKAPSFTLRDQTGKERSLEKMLKEGPVAIVFYRSADW